MNDAQNQFTTWIPFIFLFGSSTSLVFPFFLQQPFFLFVGHSLKKNLCSEAASQNTLRGFWLLKSLAIFYQHLLFSSELTTSVFWFANSLWYSCTYVLMYNTQKKRFFLRGIIRTAFSLLFCLVFHYFPKWKSLLFELLANCLQFKRSDLVNWNRGKPKSMISRKSSKSSMLILNLKSHWH
jgi:hypothetical protein